MSGLRRLGRNRRGLLGGVVVVTMLAAGVFAPVIAPYSYSTQSLLQRLKPPTALVSLGTDGFGRSENRVALRDFFEVDAKHIVLATLGALAREKKVGTDVVKRAVQELGINPEKMNPAIG